MAIKEPTVEKDADAEAIFWEVRLDDKKQGFLAYDHYVRVKVFTERGREKFSKHDIFFAKGKKVKNIAARVVKADGSIIELKPQDVFEREVVKGDGIKVKAISFAIAGVEPGVIVEYRYREEFKADSLSGERLVFQRDIPIRNISYYLRPFPGNKLRTENFNIPSEVTLDKAPEGFFVARMTDVPAFKEEPRMPPADVVRPWILLYYDSFFGIQKWEQLAGRYSEAIKSWIKQNKEVKNAAVTITAGATTNEEKVKKIYEYCQTQIKNISFDRAMTDEQKEKIDNKTPGDTLKRRMGSVLDIELLFAALASAAGFESRLSLANDRSEFFFDPNRNTHSSFVEPRFIAVKIDDKWRFFNPGAPFLAYGDIVWYEQGVKPIMVGEGTYSIGYVPMEDYPKNLTRRTGNFKLSAEGALEGDVRIEYSGQPAISRRRAGWDSTDQKRQDDYIESIKARISTAEVSYLTMENFNDPYKPLVYNYKIKIPNYASKTGKRLFLQPGFFEYNVKPVFTSTTRTHQIYFSYPWSEQDEVEISLPEGYSLDNADAPAPMADPSKIGSIEIQLQTNTDKSRVKLSRKFHFGGGGNILFPASAIVPMKNLFDAFHKADSHTLSVKQKQ
jgi:hypothetical protein